MAVDTKHPTITAEVIADWKRMRDAAAGESTVKLAGETYLPMPSGFAAMPDRGSKYYAAYKMRAQFPEIVAPSVSAMIGIAHAKEAQIELPPALEYMTETATPDGLTLDVLHRRITRELLTVGRFGLLADAPETGGSPWLAGYKSESIINWDEGFYVLNETAMIRDGFKWAEMPRYRVLELIDGAYQQSIWQGQPAVQMVVPAMAAGGKAMPRVPFSVATAVDMTPTICPPPLIGVSRSAMSIYQLSADYRWQLYMSGQETLVAINGDAPKAVGPGVAHSMRGADGQTPDLKYVSPTCSGIEAHRLAMEDCRKEAVAAGARLFDQSDTSQESGEARSLRYASETATLMSVVLASCGLLERGLRDIAMMLGQDENAVVVTPPSDLLDSTMTPADAAALVGVWQNGAMSYDTLYDNLQRGGIASAERTADDELALIDKRDIDESDGGDAAV